MEKTKKLQKSSISQNEYRLIEKIKLSGLSVFGTDDIKRLLRWSENKIYYTIYTLRKKGMIVEALGGRYILSSILTDYDILTVTSQLIWPAYLSFWTALNYYKFTEQLPLTIFIATTKSRKEVEIEKTKIKFVRISKHRFFGYRKINGIVMAEKEKALIDSLLLPRYAGGIIEISRCLKNSWSELDKKILIDYAMRMKNKSLLKRLGYLIETENLKIDKKLIEKLQKNIGKGYSKLDPQLERKGSYNKRWGLIVNL